MVERGAVGAGVGGEVPGVGVFQRFEGRGHVFRILRLLLAACLLKVTMSKLSAPVWNSDVEQQDLRLLFGIITGRIGLLFDPIVTEVPCE